jgi:hypothetical protein
MIKALQDFYNRFVRIRGTPREVALGFALGIFVGLTPTMGLQMAIAVFFASILKWNKYSAALAVWITNPLTAPLIYGFTYIVGAKLLGIHNSFAMFEKMDWATLIMVLRKSPGIVLSLVVGGAVVGLPLAVASYFAAYKAVEGYQKKLKEKLKLQREKLKQKVSKKKHAASTQLEGQEGQPDETGQILTKEGERRG